ncbi:MAG: hypothetical protein KBA26_02295 [Candidatus Delongbacteria bacterium]|nr:hypothetical protein [Candidatus Delongbacteria bacterium]
MKSDIRFYHPPDSLVGYISTALSLSLSSILFLLSLPPFHYSFTLFFFLIPAAWVWLVWPRSAARLSLIPGLIFFLYFRIDQSSTSVILGWLICITALQLLLLILAEWSRDRFRYLPLWTLPALLVMADAIRFRFWGTLYSLASLLSDYPWLIRSSDTFGPLFPGLLLCFTQFWLVYRWLYPHRIKALSWSAMGILWLILIAYGLGANPFGATSTRNLIVTFTVPDKPILDMPRFVQRLDQVLQKIPGSPDQPRILLLPFLPYVLPSENEAGQLKPWESIAHRHQVDIIYGCRDTLLDYAVCPYINALGRVVEIGEQQTLFRFGPPRYRPGDYTLGIDGRLGRIGVLCNEEVFFDYPAKILNRSGYGMIYNPMENTRRHSMEYIRKALVVSAVMNRQAILSNINNGGQIGINPDGRSVHFMQLFKRILFYQIELKSGKAFSRYQRWGDLVFYGVFLMFGMPLLIRALILMRSRLELQSRSSSRF